MDDKAAHVLVVDDEKVQRLAISRWLRSAGFKCTTCASGAEAWDKMQEVSFDLVLTDSQMPEMTGPELLAKIVQSAMKVPVLLMSAAEVTATAASDAIAAGCEDYIFKPLIPAVLLKKVETVLSVDRGKKRTKELQSLMDAKEAEIATLRQQVRQTQDTLSLETPFHKVTTALASVLEDANLTADARERVDFALRMIRSNTDLYTPHIAASVDPATKSLLQSYMNSKAGFDATSITFPSISVEEQAVQGLRTWSFNCWGYTEEELLPFIKTMYRHFGLIKRFNLTERKLESFILTMRAKYNDNPYHNFRHAFDVLQTVYCLLTSFDSAQYLTHLDLLITLTAALGHDVGHPGVNNKYLVAVGDDLALLHNDRSVLENHHVYVTFSVLRDDENNFVENLSPEERIKFRQGVIQCILSTDMAQHFTIMSKLEEKLKAGVEMVRENATDRLTIMETILKASDISNIAKPWNVSLKWSKVLTREFFAQGDLERSRGLEPEAFMDRTKTTMSKITTGFTRFVALKYFELLAKLLPKASSIVDCIHDNLKHWDQWTEADDAKALDDDDEVDGDDSDVVSGDGAGKAEAD